MSPVDDIREIFARGRPDVPNPYHGQFNSLLFVEFSFSTDMDWDLNEMSVPLHNVGQKPVFIFLILPESQYSNPVTCTEADSTMRRLLTEADTPLRMMHGVCVSGTRIAFYCYGREQQTILPISQGQMRFDLDLAAEGGAELPSFYGPQSNVSTS